MYTCVRKEKVRRGGENAEFRRHMAENEEERRRKREGSSQLSIPSDGAASFMTTHTSASSRLNAFYCSKIRRILCHHITIFCVKQRPWHMK